MANYELPSLLILPLKFFVLAVCKVDERSFVFSASDAAVKVEVVSLLD